MKRLEKDHSGFTLIELLLVVGIIAILASIVIVAINPTKQLGQHRDAQRASDVNIILNALYKYAVDNNGILPKGIPVGEENAVDICKTEAQQESCEAIGGIKLQGLTGAYIPHMPVDPLVSPEAPSTLYGIYKDENDRVTVFAEGEGDAGIIRVTR